LTEYLEINKCEDKDINSILSILFQICFGLAVAQKEYSFVHNDLHASNIMLKNTEQKYLNYCYRNKFYKIPTFNKIVKIIDFERSAFYYKGRFFISDVFSKDGDAEGQVIHPSVRNKNIPKPNPSFDLAFLSTTIIEYFEDDKYKELRELLKSWTKDKHGHYLYNEDNDFDLYVNISKNVRNVIPKDQILHSLFKRFEVNKKDISGKTYYL